MNDNCVNCIYAVLEAEKDGIIVKGCTKDKCVGFRNANVLYSMLFGVTHHLKKENEK